MSFNNVNSSKSFYEFACEKIDFFNGVFKTNESFIAKEFDKSTIALFSKLIEQANLRHCFKVETNQNRQFLLLARTEETSQTFGKTTVVAEEFLAKLKAAIPVVLSQYTKENWTYEKGRKEYCDYVETSYFVHKQPQDSTSYEFFGLLKEYCSEKKSIYMYVNLTKERLEITHHGKFGKACNYYKDIKIFLRHLQKEVEKCPRERYVVHFKGVCSIAKEGKLASSPSELEITTVVSKLPHTPFEFPYILQQAIEMPSVPHV